MNNIVKIYTDGSCIPNPGPGGWAFISIENDCEFHINGYDPESTNNRMELTAIIEAIKFYKNKTELTIYSDSQLSINCAQGLWKRNKNKDLWILFDKVSKSKKINFIKVKAHNGDKYNELVDKLAKNAILEK